MTIIVEGSFRLPIDQLDVAKPAMIAVMEATRSEDGCLAYSYALDVADPGLVRVSEAWRDRAALDAHLQTPHMERWRAERAGLGLYARDIRAYVADDGEPI